MFTLPVKYEKKFVPQLRYKHQQYTEKRTRFFSSSCKRKKKDIITIIISGYLFFLKDDDAGGGSNPKQQYDFQIGRLFLFSSSRLYLFKYGIQQESSKMHL